MKSDGVTYEEYGGVTYGAHRGLGRIHFPDQRQSSLDCRLYAPLHHHEKCWSSRQSYILPCAIFFVQQIGIAQYSRTSHRFCHSVWTWNSFWVWPSTWGTNHHWLQIIHSLIPSVLLIQQADIILGALVTFGLGRKFVPGVPRNSGISHIITWFQIIRCFLIPSI